MEKQILEVVLDIQTNQIKMQQDISELKDAYKELQNDNKSIKQDIYELKTRVSNLEELRRIDSLNIAQILKVQVEQFRRIDALEEA